MREGFVFYRGFADALSDLEPEDRLACYDAICKYALDGTVPELKGVPSAIFKMARPQIDANNQKYENGKRGGRPKTEQKPNDNQTETKAKPNDNQTITEPEPKEKDKEKVKENTPYGVQKKTAHKYGLYKNVLLTDEQMEKLKAEFPDYSQRIERLSEYIKSKGAKYKDHLATIRAWARKDKEEKPPNKFNNFEGRKYSADDYLNLERTVAGVENIL